MYGKKFFTPMTLAFSCEVVHEKLWKSVNICKSYSKKSVAPFFSGHSVYVFITIFILFSFEQEIRSVELGVCPMQFFYSWLRDVHPLQSAAVYKISWKSDDLSLRYSDISIFKMATVRHLGIVHPPYETTHEVSVAGCSCLSNFMSMWYTDLKI